MKGNGGGADIGAGPPTKRLTSFSQNIQIGIEVVSESLRIGNAGPCRKLEEMRLAEKTERVQIRRSSEEQSLIDG